MHGGQTEVATDLLTASFLRATNPSPRQTLLAAILILRRVDDVLSVVCNLFLTALLGLPSCVLLFQCFSATQRQMERSTNREFLELSPSSIVRGSQILSAEFNSASTGNTGLGVATHIRVSRP